jgi:anti-sigma28 factor (negative regulator of flagellin synthesis)
MQVNNNSLNLSAAIGQTSAVVPNKVSGAKNGQSSSGGDSVQLSGLASLLATDPTKLAQLQAAYQSGTYNVSPSQIASSLINDAFEG